VYYNLGNAYFYSNDYENSIKSYLRVLTLNPYDKLTYNNLGVVYERMGMIDAAIENYKKSADLGYEPAENVLRFYNVKY
jgi:tetratricopeptide (TPR) repeat protein